MTGLHFQLELVVWSQVASCNPPRARHHVRALDPGRYSSQCLQQSQRLLGEDGRGCEIRRDRQLAGMTPPSKSVRPVSCPVSQSVVYGTRREPPQGGLGRRSDDSRMGSIPESSSSASSCMLIAP
ncbi:hypothetical protein B0T17DRAFT_46707 [Bombardia bombarda]|uniref:Uncharacterized protein n=1 Tax=Bombardia bombarda TaxID=252184 RepID=A0AA39XKX4_9PEZI|nr:hypothetical protein B0T17DRAFT_46707 [Bombardia bombarda]